MNPNTPRGTNVEYVAAAWPSDYGSLPEAAADHLEQLKRELNKQWRVGDQEARRRLGSAEGCIDRLSSFLLQVSRLRRHAQTLAEDPLSLTMLKADPRAGMCIALRADEACSDFEALLFHGRAALDRLTLFVSSEFGQRSDRFSRFTKLLGSFKKSPTAARYARIVGACNNIPGVLADADGRRSLRSVVAHQGSVLEGASNAFTVHYIDRETALVFDCISMGYPVIATARELAADVPFLVQNSLAVALNWREVRKTKFAPNWENPCAVFADYVDETEMGPAFSVVRLGPDEIGIETRHLRPEVLSHKRRIA